MTQQTLLAPPAPWYESELVEGANGFCHRCGSPLIEEGTLSIPHEDYVGKYCMECHHLTPPLPNPSSWCPVGGGWLKPSADTLRDRTERRLSGNWVV